MTTYFRTDPEMWVHLDLAEISRSDVEEVKDIITQHPGNTFVYFVVGDKILELGEECKVDRESLSDGILAKWPGTRINHRNANNHVKNLFMQTNDSIASRTRDWEVSGKTVGLTSAIDSYMKVMSTAELTMKTLQRNKIDYNDSSTMPMSTWTFHMYSSAIDVRDNLRHLMTRFDAGQIYDLTLIKRMEMVKERGLIEDDPINGAVWGTECILSGINAGLTYVNEDVAGFVDDASNEMDDVSMFSTDLIAPSGFIYLQKPIQSNVETIVNIPDIGDFPVSVPRTIRAFSWCERHDENFGKQIVFVPFMENDFDSDAYIKSFIERLKQVNGGKLPPVTNLEKMQISLSRWGLRDKGWHTGKLVPCSVISEFDNDGRYSIDTPFLKFFLCLMRFCFQEIASTKKLERTDVDRGAWRRIERERGGIEANIVYLRRYKTKNDKSEVMRVGSLEYQSLTRGHWKNHYHSSLGPVGDPNAYRLIWIDQYWRGPEWAPIRRSPKVTAVVR